MKSISCSEFLTRIAEVLNCSIYHLDGEGVVFEAKGKGFEKYDVSELLSKDERQELAGSTHIRVRLRKLAEAGSCTYADEIYVPADETERAQGLLWLFPREDRLFNGTTEELTVMAGALTDAAMALMDMAAMKGTNSLYSQALFHVGNLLPGGLMLFDGSDRLLFRSTTADKLDLLRDGVKAGNDREMRIVEFHSGNVPIGKLKYGNIHNRLEGSLHQQESPSEGMNKIIGKDPQINRVLSEINKVAPTDSTVLLRGESGTGKELYARLIHNKSSRKDKPFVALNCAAIPENLLESELFGYEGGSFTGANKEGKAGKFVMADKGTIFLDEIGDMPLSLQVKLLRVLQERRIEPIGGSRPVTIDVRIICATHQNLESKIAAGEFREDLYYRINVIPIDIPSLNSMHHDIEMLLTHYLKKYCILQKKDFMYFSHDAMEALKNYHWQGNVRELINVVEYCVTMSTKSVIEISGIPRYIQLDKPDQEKDMEFSIKRTGRPSAEELAKLVSQYGNTKEGKIRLAKHLDVSVATLYRWLSKNR